MYSCSGNDAIEAAADISDIDRISNHSISSVTKQVCSGISGWVRKQPECLLKENQHFMVKAQRCMHSSTILVFVQCLPCGRISVPFN